MSRDHTTTSPSKTVSWRNSTQRDPWTFRRRLLKNGRSCGNNSILPTFINGLNNRTPIEVGPRDTSDPCLPSRDRSPQDFSTHFLSVKDVLPQRLSVPYPTRDVVFVKDKSGKVLYGGFRFYDFDKFFHLGKRGVYSRVKTKGIKTILRNKRRRIPWKTVRSVSSFRAMRETS